METIIQAQYDDVVGRVGETTLSRIEKLFNLAKLGTESEASVAMSKALDMLAKHNLSTDDVDVFSGRDAIIDSEILTNDKKTFDTWRSVLIRAISESHFCYVYKSPATSEYVITGKKANRDAVLLLYRYLCSIVDEESRKAVAQYDGWENKKSFGNSFRQGMVSRITARLYGQKSMIRKQAMETGSDIVVADPYLIATETNLSFIRKNGIRLAVGRTSSGASGAGYHQGREAGKNIGLTAGRALPSK